TTSGGINGVSLTGMAGSLTVGSGGGTNGISLTAVTGTLSTGGTGGSLSGASGATFNVSGGTVSATYTGNITQANNAAMVNIAGGHNTGTITFQTGTLDATNGTGIQLSNADGTYNFNGTDTLHGGDAGIEITTGSGGSFSFSSNTSITNPTGTGFTANVITAAVTYSGNITKNGTST